MTGFYLIRETVADDYAGLLRPPAARAAVSGEELPPGAKQTIREAFQKNDPAPILRKIGGLPWLLSRWKDRDGAEGEALPVPLPSDRQAKSLEAVLGRNPGRILNEEPIVMARAKFHEIRSVLTTLRISPLNGAQTAPSLFLSRLSDALDVAAATARDVLLHDWKQTPSLSLIDCDNLSRAVANQDWAWFDEKYAEHARGIDLSAAAHRAARIRELPPAVALVEYGPADRRMSFSEDEDEPLVMYVSLAAGWRPSLLVSAREVEAALDGQFAEAHVFDPEAVVAAIAAMRELETGRPRPSLVNRVADVVGTADDQVFRELSSYRRKGGLHDRLDALKSLFHRAANANGSVVFVP